MRRKRTLTEARQMFDGWLSVFDNVVRDLDKMKKANAVKAGQFAQAFQRWSDPYNTDQMEKLLSGWADWLGKVEVGFEGNCLSRGAALRGMVAIARKWHGEEMWRVIEIITPKNSQFRHRLPPSKR